MGHCFPIKEAHRRSTDSGKMNLLKSHVWGVSEEVEYLEYLRAVRYGVEKERAAY